MHCYIIVDKEWKSFDIISYKDAARDTVDAIAKDVGFDKKRAGGEYKRIAISKLDKTISSVRDARLHLGEAPISKIKGCDCIRYDGEIKILTPALCGNCS